MRTCTPDYMRITFSNTKRTSRIYKCRWGKCIPIILIHNLETREQHNLNFVQKFDLLCLISPDKRIEFLMMVFLGRHCHRPHSTMYSAHHSVMDRLAWHICAFHIYIHWNWKLRQNSRMAQRVSIDYWMNSLCIRETRVYIWAHANTN